MSGRSLKSPNDTTARTKGLKAAILISINILVASSS